MTASNISNITDMNIISSQCKVGQTKYDHIKRKWIIFLSVTKGQLSKKQNSAELDQYCLCDLDLLTVTNRNRNGINGSPLFL